MAVELHFCTRCEHQLTVEAGPLCVYCVVEERGGSVMTCRDPEPLARLIRQVANGTSWGRQLAAARRSA